MKSKGTNNDKDENKDKNENKGKDERQNATGISSLNLTGDSIVDTGILSNTSNESNSASNTTNSLTKEEDTNSSNSTSNSQNKSITGTSNQSTSTTSTTDTLSEEIANAANTLKSINTMKEELCKLPLDLCERQYFDNRVVPLLTTLNFLSAASTNLATSINILTTSPIVPRKKGKLKSTINLIYDINSECHDVFKELKDRIEIMINEE